MKYDRLAIREAERGAFSLLTAPHQMVTKFDKEKNDYVTTKEVNKFYVRPENVTMPVELVQEQAFVNTQNTFTFDFSLNGPQPSPVLNNVPLGANNIAVIYGIRILQGEGANGNARNYRSTGITVADSSVYNSRVGMKYEQSTLIEKISGQMFNDVFPTPTEKDSNAGLVLINPMRIVTGKLGVFTGFIDLINPINALVLSANVFLSFRLLVCYGQASATR